MKGNRNNFFNHFFAVIIILICCSFANNDYTWQKVSAGINENKVNCIAIHPINNNIIFAGTPKAIYKSKDKGQTYQITFQLSTKSKSINDLYIDPHNTEFIYAATDNGLYLSTDLGLTWNQIFKSQKINSQKCLTVLTDDKFVYLGTLKGLYIKQLSNNTWKLKEGELSNHAVYAMFQDNTFLYIVTEYQLFRLDKKQGTIQKVFTNKNHSQNAYAKAPYQTNHTEISKTGINDIYITSKPNQNIYLACHNGLYVSKDYGKTWSDVKINGITQQNIATITAIEHLNNNHSEIFIIAGTQRGVYKLNNNYWFALYKGMESNSINCLTTDQSGTLYAATNKGIFSIKYTPEKTDNHRILCNKEYLNIKQKFSFEPTIQEVHSLAINYANVSSNKITMWKKQAKRKALLPKMSISYGQDKNMTLSDSMWGTSSGDGKHYTGPDDKTFYDNLGWDISLSWDFSELLWNSDQATIDSRSKSMVELREDILDQITRIYFERRRIQIELINNIYVDSRTKIEREMRIEELTAMIDGLTGGEFSRKSVSRNKLSFN